MARPVPPTTSHTGGMVPAFQAGAILFRATLFPSFQAAASERAVADFHSDPVLSLIAPGMAEAAPAEPPTQNSLPLAAVAKSAPSQSSRRIAVLVTLVSYCCLLLRVNTVQMLRSTREVEIRDSEFVQILGDFCRPVASDLFSVTDDRFGNVFDH